MSVRLVCCASCGRHVHDGDARCPFCDEPLDSGAGALGTSVRASRAALYHRSSAVALVACAALAACGKNRVTASATEDAAKPADAEKHGSAPRGARCAETADCAKGLICCMISYEGRCGGPPPPPGAPPCVVTQVCQPKPCTGPSFPPYGCVFPDACAPTRV